MPSRTTLPTVQSYADIFASSKTTIRQSVTEVIELLLEQMHDFKGHPFQVRDDELMLETAKSIAKYGVLVPSIVRPCEGGYEIVAGHRQVCV